MSRQEQIFKEYLKVHKLKFTPQRQTILREALGMHHHFDANELFLKIKQRHRKTSRGSVYRTLPLLVKAGIIREVIFIDRHTHYEQIFGKKHHSHLICTKCGKIIEFCDERIKRALGDVAKKNKFKAEAHKVEITGLCKDCK